jgi:hypothetical protein
MQRKNSDTRSSGEESEASMDVGSEKKYGTTDAAAAACQKSRAAEIKNRRLALLQHSKDERVHPSPVKCRRRIGEDTKEARENCHIPKNSTPPSIFLRILSFFQSSEGHCGFQVPRDGFVRWCLVESVESGCKSGATFWGSGRPALTTYVPYPTNHTPKCLGIM